MANGDVVFSRSGVVLNKVACTTDDKKQASSVLQRALMNKYSLISERTSIQIGRAQLHWLCGVRDACSTDSIDYDEINGIIELLKSEGEFYIRMKSG